MIGKNINSTKILEQNKNSWDAMADSWFGSTALPSYGCLVPSEEELQLFPALTGKKVLDIGCGSGHSLKWCKEHGAEEIWGLDMSTRQLENARTYLTQSGYEPHLINAPMESDCGLPTDYFDVVYSIYALGWTVDLNTTIDRISRYLKRDGILIFSWDHPLMRCIDAEGEKLVLNGSYLNENPLSYIQRGNPVTIHNHKMSGWINALAGAGFKVEKLVEETDADTLSHEYEFSDSYYSPFRAKKMPLSFIIKAVKL